MSKHKLTMCEHDKAGYGDKCVTHGDLEGLWTLYTEVHACIYVQWLYNFCCMYHNYLYCRTIKLETLRDSYPQHIQIFHCLQLLKHLYLINGCNYYNHSLKSEFCSFFPTKLMYLNLLNSLLPCVHGNSSY